MTHRMMTALMAVAVALGASGCGGYWPLRWPERDLWAATPVRPEPVRVPSPLSGYSHQLSEGGVTVAMDLLSPSASLGVFHLDLAARGIQPVLLAIENRSDQTYEFRKADLGGVAIVPAARIGQWACPHPVRVTAGYLKWLIFFVPGLVFEAVVEPATTFDFPIIHEASRHPSWPNCRQARQGFLEQELADGQLPPGQSLAGVVFTRALPLDGTLTVALRNTQTQDVLSCVLPTPASTVSQVQMEAHPAALVWPVVVKNARRMPSWRVQSADQAAGVVRIAKRSELTPWSRATPVTVSVRSLGPDQTQVTAESSLRVPLSTELETSSKTINQFFDALSPQLPRPPAPAPVPPGADSRIAPGYGHDG